MRFTELANHHSIPAFYMSNSTDFMEFFTLIPKESTAWVPTETSSQFIIMNPPSGESHTNVHPAPDTLIRLRGDAVWGNKWPRKADLGCM